MEHPHHGFSMMKSAKLKSLVPSKPPIMPYIERRQLIERPFLSQRIPPKTWGGVNVGNAGRLPEEGRRVSGITTEDEELWAKIREGLV